MDYKQKLKEQGWHVNFKSKRVVNLAGNNLLVAEGDLKKSNLSHLIQPRGGETEATLVSPTGKVTTGRTVCSKKENFHRKVGIKLALERALEAVEGEKPNV